MADLNDLNASQSVKIAGADPTTGVESNYTQVSSSGELYSIAKSVVSTANSTTTPLGSNATFIGTAEMVADYAMISIQVFSDRQSAGQGFKPQYSINGTNWDDGDSYTIPLNDGKFFTFPPQALYFRIVYTNGNNAQSVFRLQTIFHKNYTKASSHRIDENMSGENDAELVKAVITGKRADAAFATIQQTNNNELNIADISNNGGAEAALSVTGTATLVNCSGSNLANRKHVTLHNNNGLVTIYWGHTSSVTPTTGTPIGPGQDREWSVGPSTNIYAVSAGGTVNTRVTERA